MTITIYELLGLVKDGQAPKKIKYPMGDCEEFYTRDLYERLFDEDIVLTDTVEILEEENKIEKLGDFDLTKYSRDDEDLGLQLNYTGVSNTFNDVYFKINEVIDKVNKLKEK